MDSPSMCARRVFEITACGTPVVTTPSRAIGEFFPGRGVRGLRPRGGREHGPGARTFRGAARPCDAPGAAPDLA
ncbi:glycosyltransferase [Oerskovia sp. M15]